MSIGSRIKEARERAGLSQVELSKILKVSKGTIGNYESDISSPKDTILFRLCKVLNVDPNFIFQDEMEGIDRDPIVSTEELKLIKKYRTIDGYGKEAINAVLEVEHKRCEAVQAESLIDTEFADEQPNAICLRFIDQRVSAGTGVYLDDGYHDDIISVPDTPTTRRADFALKISGDSMKPEFSDGDIIFIENTDAVDIGEIGIFIVDGEGYIKKLGQNKLVSFNPKYEDIIINEYNDVRCKGRVIGSM